MADAGKLSAVWDVTLGYVGLRQGAGEKDLLMGNWPSEVHFHVRRFAAEDVLRASVGGGDREEGAARWLKERWAEKEQELIAFEDSRSSYDSSSKNGPYPVMLADTHEISAFPWCNWLLTGAPLYLAFTGYVHRP